MEKCRSILLKLRDHLMVNYPDLTTWTLNHDGKDLAPPLIHKDPKSSSFFLIVTLKSKQDLAMADIQPADNVVDAKVSRLPWTSKSFKLVFYPVIIVSQDKSCRCFLAVSLVSHQGHRIKNDFATFTLNYSPDEQDVLTTEAEISPTLSETTLSNCDLLTKVSVLSSDGFTLCSGLKHKFHKSLQTQSVYIEPTPDGEFLVRSRNCNFITELQEMYSKDTSSSRSNLSCTKCCEMDKALEIEVLEQKLEPIETDLMTDSSVKIENFLSDFPEVESPCEDSIDQQTNVKSTKCLKKFKTQQGSAKHLASSCGVTEEVQKIYFQDIEVKTKDHVNVSSYPTSKEKILATKRRRKIPKKSKSKKDSEHFEGKASEFSEFCVVCLRTFHTEITFTKHLEAHKERIHDWESKTQCPVWECDQTFPNRLELNVHFISAHKNDQFSEKIPCAFCLKIIQRDKIRSHFRGEHPQKKFSCTECGRECLFPSQLKQHWKDMHDPENSKDYVCHLCGNIYARKTGLKQHMASQHSDDRDFKCDYCGKGFTNVQRLRQHVRIHTGVKPFKCKICEYRSNRSDNVLFHLRKVHKIEKPTVVSNVDVFEDQLS